MAVRDEPLRRSFGMDPRVGAGLAALAAITVLIGGAFAGMVSEAARDWSGAASAFDAYMLRVARFTLWQAALSTLLSVVPALFVARALARHPRFPGRSMILRLFGVPLALPSLVAALGILALYGRAGYFAEPLGLLHGGQWPGIYGLSGILIAHIFFNMPLATRLFLHALETIPADQWRLSAQLGMNARATFQLLEWPVLRASLAGVAALVFMLCITSFTIVLLLGGGPRATTLEVAIYQALRFDFDPARAVALVALQVALVATSVFLIARLGADVTADRGLPVAPSRPPLAGPIEKTVNIALIAAALAFVAGPMAAIVAAGLQADLPRLATDPAVHAATLTSLVLAALAAILSVTLSFALVSAASGLQQARRQKRASFLERAMGDWAAFVLVIPPIVIGAGWFILLRHTGQLFALAPVMVVTVNAVMAIPFAIRALRPGYDAAAARHDRLAASLGMAGLARWRLVDWPVLRRPLLTAFAFAMALSLGDLGVIALFGSDAVQTLPYLLLQRMGAYRTADAAGLALFLGILCLLLMMLADGRGRSTR
ncbi:MAG: thiamine/thiamine pyrophosphate ABC transporter permease [Mesorhizobium sp.]|nr:thiamine/thiamine pyrophosphate ABC transporter permease [Mesorhizobium sp.]